MKPDENTNIIEVRPDLFIGVVPDIQGAASFASSRSKLKHRLKDAVNCIIDYNTHIKKP